MPTLDAVRVKNLRSLGDTGFIPQTPLTVLVGKNSAGKSTYARIFPLFRQSVDEAKRGPLLWWGRLVDYGSFGEAVNRRSNHKEIEFCFRISMSRDDRIGRVSGRSDKSIAPFFLEGAVDVSMAVRTGEKSSYVASIGLKAFGSTCVMRFDKPGVLEDCQVGDNVWRLKKERDLTAVFVPGKVLSRPVFLRKRSAESSPLFRWEEQNPLTDELVEYLRLHFLHGNVSLENAQRIASRIRLGHPSEVFEHLRLMATAPKSFQENLRLHPANSAIFRRLLDLTLASRFGMIVERVDAVLYEFFHGVKYLEPLRATAQRYYRIQELAVEEIDSKGANIAVFLESLSRGMQGEFKQWMEKHFGLAVEIESAGGHLAVKLRQDRCSASTNLADMGFGFSQVLPIAVQLWAARRGAGVMRARPRGLAATSCVVIEQPELHLHPDFQARLADVFVAAASTDHLDGTPPARLIIETHSESLINRLGQLVADGVIPASDIQIILFDQRDPDSDTVVSTSLFDQEGILSNWPLGFFQPTVG